MALSSNALTLVATAEDELGISTGTETTRLERYIEAATAICEQYCGRSFYRTTNISETVAVSGLTPFMFLSRPPINSITSITFDGTALTASDYEIRESLLGHVYSTNGSWHNSTPRWDDISRTRAFGLERKLFTVVYDGGWYTPTQGGTRGLPFDLEMACLQIVSYFRRSRGRDPFVTSESLLGSSVSYAAGNNAVGLMQLLPGVSAILDKYRIGLIR